MTGCKCKMFIDSSGGASAGRKPVRRKPPKLNKQPSTDQQNNIVRFGSGHYARLGDLSRQLTEDLAADIDNAYVSIVQTIDDYEHIFISA